MHFLFGQNRPVGSSGQTPRGEAACVRNGAAAARCSWLFPSPLPDFSVEPGPACPEGVLAWKCLGEEHMSLPPTSAAPPPSHCQGCCKTTRF